MRSAIHRTIILTTAFLAWATLFPAPVSAAGWSAPGGAKWGAKVLSVTTVAASGSTIAITYVFLEPAGASNVNSCPTFADTANSLGTGISSVIFIMAHPSLTGMTDVQKGYLAELQVAASSGKEVQLYSNGCTSPTAPGYNNIDGVWVKY